MMKDTTKTAAIAADIMLFDNWFDPIEDGVRARVRGFIESMLEEELDVALSRPRYGRRKAPPDGSAAAPLVGCRHGHRKRALTGTFGKTEIAVPRARVMGEDGKTTFEFEPRPEGGKARKPFVKKDKNAAPDANGQAADGRSVIPKNIIKKGGARKRAPKKD